MNEHTENKKYIQTEYNSLISYHNSIVTHRFTLLGFFVAAIGIIINNGIELPEAIFILFLSIAFFLIECRNRVLYKQMSMRAMEIEKNYWEGNLKKEDEDAITSSLTLFRRLNWKKLEKKMILNLGKI